MDELLAEHERDGSFFLDSPPAGSAPTIDHPIAERPGDQVGPYKLLQQIGEGGFGVVYMAEQSAPMRRKVALKIIKPGMDTKDVVARFEAERQALALMDHPNTARVFDAGATESGRPYFVMELVKGITLTEYCDRNNLSMPDRLRLLKGRLTGRLISPMCLLGRVGRSGRCALAMCARWVRPSAPTASRHCARLISPMRATPP